MTPIVFLHGFLGDPRDWDDIRSLQNPSRPTLAVKIPVAQNWDDGVRRLVRQLPKESILVGYSLGGRVAIGVALNQPQRVRGLCLVSANPGLQPSERPSRWQHDSTVIDRVESDVRSKFLYDWYRQPVFASVSDETRCAWIRQAMDFDRSYQAALLRCYSIAGQPDYWPRLGSIEAPTAVVVGQQDRKYVAIAKRMKEHATDIHVYTVPSAGHAVHRERPVALQAVLQAFCASLPRGKTADE